jgi:TPR repeat protein
MMLRRIGLACALLLGDPSHALAQSYSDPRTSNPDAVGRAAFAAGDFAKAAPLLAEAALGEDVEAHRLMGDIYSGGHAPDASVPGGRDECAALVWYDHAAHMGDGLAMRRMARAYRRGWGVKRDERMAKLWAGFADEAGAAALLADPFAQSPDPIDKRRYMAQSVLDLIGDAGEPGILPAAEIYLVPPFLWNDPDIASGLLERSLAPCDARAPGAPRAQPEGRVAAALMKGLVLKAIDNVAHAALLFSDAILFGGAVPPNSCVAGLWMERAARYGDPNAAYRLSHLLITAYGLREDTAIALFWAEVARLIPASIKDPADWIDFLKTELEIQVQLNVPGDEGVRKYQELQESMNKLARDTQVRRAMRANNYIIWRGVDGIYTKYKSTRAYSSNRFNCDRSPPRGLSPLH